MCGKRREWKNVYVLEVGRVAHRDGKDRVLL